MIIGHHGGMCCGIKHIFNLRESPDSSVHAEGEGDRDYVSHDRLGDPVDSDENVYYKALPRQKAGDRMDTYLEYLAQIRPYGLVEVALQVDPKTGPQIAGHKMSKIEEGLVSFEEAFVTEAGEDSWLGFKSTQEAWIPFLEKRGFKEVNSFANINSGNIVKVYHLVMRDDWTKPGNKKKKTKETA